MVASLQALLAQSIDYAGMFPPAELPVKHAVKNFADYQHDKHSWMLGRLVWQVGELAALHSFSKLLRRTRPGRFVAGPLSDRILQRAARKHGIAKAKIPTGLGVCGEAEMDSLEYVEFLLQFEDEHEIEVSDELMQEIQAGRCSHFLAIVGSRCESTEDFFQTLERDVGAIAQFQRRTDQRLSVDMLELKLPNDLFQRPRAFPLTEFFDRVVAAVASQLTDVAVMIEVPHDLPWKHTIPILLEHVQQYGQRVGLKMRTGGVDQQFHPSTECLAYFISACRDALVFWKATAGLHHPLPHFNGEGGVSQHGFLNLMIASIVAQTHDLAEAQIAEILKEESAERFSFDNAGFHCGEFHVPNQMIESARRESFTSFGSCSFTEPRDGLQELNLIV